MTWGCCPLHQERAGMGSRSEASLLGLPSPPPPLPVLPDSPLSPSHAPCPSPLHQQHALSAGRSGSEAENRLGYAGVKPRTLALLLRTLSHWSAQPQSAAHMESLSEICIINLFAEGHLEHMGGGRRMLRDWTVTSAKPSNSFPVKPQRWQVFAILD